MEGSKTLDTGPWSGAFSSGTGLARSSEQCPAKRQSVMRASLALVVLSIAGGAASAQPLNEAVNGLETCFQQARIGDSICSKAVLNTAQRQDCFQKARDAQLECLEHVQQEMMAGSKPPQRPSAAPSPD